MVQLLTPTATNSAADTAGTTATVTTTATNTGIVPPAPAATPCGCKERQQRMQQEADEYSRHIRIAAFLGNAVLVLLCIYFIKRIFS